MKWAQAPRNAVHDEAHLRRVRSYDVEHAFYRHYAARSPSRVPAFRGGHAREGDWLFVLEDLDVAGFTGRRHRLNEREMRACLSWLARVHACFLGVAPDGLWANGTYWDLSVRQRELARMSDERLRAAAPRLAERLHNARFRTILHGDAKPANFCFARDGTVAALDFQYAGGGCGMQDVAYLLDEPEPGPLLDHYFAQLGAEPAVEEEWRALYPVAHADYSRFLDGGSR